MPFVHYSVGKHLFCSCCRWWLWAAPRTPRNSSMQSCFPLWTTIRNILQNFNSLRMLSSILKGGLNFNAHMQLANKQWIEQMQKHIKTVPPKSKATDLSLEWTRRPWNIITCYSISGIKTSRHGGKPNTFVLCRTSLSLLHILFLLQMAPSLALMHSCCCLYFAKVLASHFVRS